MLTAFQCEVVAYVTENGELLCPDCFRDGDDYAKPVIRYGLDEEQTARAEGWLDWDYLDEVSGEGHYQRRLGPDGRWHVEACCCEPTLEDDDGHVLLEAYDDPSCDEPLEEDDEDDPTQEDTSVFEDRHVPASS